MTKHYKEKLPELEAIQLITLHCEYCNHLERLVHARGKQGAIRRRLEALHRRMFRAMTGRMPNKQEMKWMRFE